MTLRLSHVHYVAIKIAHRTGSNTWQTQRANSAIRGFDDVARLNEAVSFFGLCPSPQF
jgi:hypothetical protein